MTTDAELQAGRLETGQRPFGTYRFCSQSAAGLPVARHEYPRYSGVFRRGRFCPTGAYTCEPRSLMPISASRRRQNAHGVVAMSSSRGRR